MKSVREACIISVVAGLCGVIAFFAHPKAPAFHVDELEVELEEVLRLEEAFWIDARSDEDFEKGHLEGALSLNEERWEEQIVDFLDAWNPDAPTVVYCSSQACLRSHEVAERLKAELGVENIFVLKGGWEKLAEAGMVEGVNQ